MPAQTTPQQRSNLARKAAQARWSHVGQAEEKYSSPSLPSYTGHCEANSAEAISPADNETRPAYCKPRKAKSQPPTANRADWLSTRFCLRLEQDFSGAWWLLTPAGLCLPASPAEISLWLDLQTLRAQYRQIF